MLVFIAEALEMCVRKKENCVSYGIPRKQLKCGTFVSTFCKVVGSYGWLELNPKSLLRNGEEARVSQGYLMILKFVLVGKSCFRD